MIGIAFACVSVGMFFISRALRNKFGEMHSLYTMYVLFNCYMAQGDLRVVLDGEMYWIFLVHLHQLLA